MNCLGASRSSDLIRYDQALLLASLAMSLIRRPPCDLPFADAILPAKSI